MAELPKPEEVASAIKAAVSGILDKDVATWRGFQETQVSKMAQQALWIAEAKDDGDFDDNPQLLEFFLNDLEDMAKTFANTLRGLVAITVEKVWNAVVGVLWDTIEKAIGIALPKPI